MQGIKVIADNCTACGACEEVCAYDAIHVIDTTAEINEKCTLCGACVDACDFDAIEIHRTTRRNTVNRLTVSVLPVGAIPSNSPLCVQRNVTLVITLSPSAMMSLIVR